MFGLHKFTVGQRVQPSAKGLDRLMFKPRKGITYIGTVKQVDRYNSPTVLWDGRRTTATYYAEFIEPAARKRRPNQAVAPGHNGGSEQ